MEFIGSSKTTLTDNGRKKISKIEFENSYRAARVVQGARAAVVGEIRIFHCEWRSRWPGFLYADVARRIPVPVKIQKGETVNDVHCFRTFTAAIKFDCLFPMYT